MDNMADNNFTNKKERSFLNEENFIHSEFSSDNYRLKLLKYVVRGELSRKVPYSLSGKDLLELYNRGDLTQYSTLYTINNLDILADYVITKSYPSDKQLDYEQIYSAYIKDHNVLHFCFKGMFNLHRGKDKVVWAQTYFACKWYYTLHIIQKITRPKVAVPITAFLVLIMVFVTNVVTVGSTGSNLFEVIIENLEQSLLLKPTKTRSYYYADVDQAANAFLMPEQYKKQKTTKETIDIIEKSAVVTPVTTLLRKYVKENSGSVYLRIEQYNDNEFTHEAETNGDAKKLTISHQDFYLSGNSIDQQIVWNTGPFIYTLYGEVSQDSLLEIIDMNF